MALLDLTYERFLSKINAANGTNLTMDQVSFSEPRSNTNTNLGSSGYNIRVRPKNGSSDDSFLFNYDKLF